MTPPPGKKVLIITYYWPPAGGPGVQRWLKFANYLPDFGHEPIILTVDPGKAEYPVRDASLLDEIRPGTRVYRTGVSGWYDLYKKFTKAKTAPYSGFVNDGTPSLKQKLARFVRGNFFLPDARRGWNKHAYRAALRLLREESIDAVITTGPPMSTHLVGQRLQRVGAARWIADFRDPWTDIYYYDKLYPTALARALDRRYEREVLSRANAIITVSHYIRRQLLAKSAKIAPGKVRVIPNGYDARDFREECPKEEPFTIAYTGTLAADYPVGAFVAAIKRLPADRHFRLRFTGAIDPAPARALDDLGERVERQPFVPHAEAIRQMKRASLLLLIIPDMPGNQGNLTGKLFEYIGSGTPVLCLGPVDGEAAAILCAQGAGQTLAYDDEEGILAYLNKRLASPPSPRRDHAPDYSRESLTRALAAILDEHED
ncbi:MAG: glycosyltransferase family 4 protein [Odoribacteraceae bacterium]|jgi:glycosyltransferase involved in cell wall biosynthesis|nr:glycosyltransferase family 4 protein [Odoribacteraceae bacterium]